MKKYLIAFSAAVILSVVVLASMSWFYGRTSERKLQDMTRRCVERGMIASSSIEHGLLSTHVKFSCVKKVVNGAGTANLEGAAEAK